MLEVRNTNGDPTCVWDCVEGKPELAKGVFVGSASQLYNLLYDICNVVYYVLLISSSNK